MHRDSRGYHVHKNQNELLLRVNFKKRENKHKRDENHAMWKGRNNKTKSP